MADYSIKSGDSLPDLLATLQDGNGVAVNLATAVAVVFNLRKQGAATALISRAASIVSAPAGTVKFEWLNGDTDSMEGQYQGEFVVEFTAGIGTKFSTFPNNGYIAIEVVEEIN